MKNTTAMRLVLFVCFLTNFTRISAQENFRPGFIITNTNDTIHGFISQVNVNIFQHCLFKKMLTDNEISYSPGEIRAYRLVDNGKFYITKKAPLDTEKKLCFLEFLIKGKVSVYFMRDDMDHYFAESENDSIIELSDRLKLQTNDWGTQYYKHPSFQGKLKYLFRNCPELFRRIDHTNLQPEKLINITKEYHNRVCNSEQCIIFEKKISPLKVHVGIMGGISLNSFMFGTLSRTDFQLSPQVGCNFEFENLFFSSEQSTLNVGLTFHKYSHYNRDNYKYGEFTYFMYKDNIDLKVLALKIPIEYHYTFSLGKTRPYLGAGFVNTVVLSQNKSLQGNFLTQPGETFKFYQLGGIGVAGVKHMLKNKHFISAQLSYEYSKNLYVDGLISLTSNTLSLNIGYEL